MANISTMFTAELLRQAMKDLREFCPKVNVKDHGLTWSKFGSRTHYFFEYKDFYWECVAGDANEARYKGWTAYMKSQGVSKYQEED